MRLRLIAGFQPRPRFGNFLFYVGVVFRKLVVLRLAELTAARVFKQPFFLMQILTPTPKPAIAENRTRGRANPDPKTGNCRKPHQGSRQPRPQNRQLPKTVPGVAPTPTPKSAIAENRTRGRAKPDPKIGNCRKPHQGSCDARRVARIRCEFPHSGSRSGTFPEIWPEDRSTAGTACDKKTIISNQNQPTGSLLITVKRLLRDRGGA